MRQARYWLLGIAITVALAAGYYCWIVSALLQSFRMTNQVYQELRSPDGRYMATLAYRDGPTFGYYFVSLQPAIGWHHLQPEAPLPHDEVAEVAAEGLETIAWAGADKLVVAYDKSSQDKTEFVLQKKTWHGVHLVYRGS